VENFGKAASLDTHKALLHIFFAQRTTKKVKGVTDGGLEPRRMHRLAVLGGGLMGSGICTAALAAGMDVVLKEVDEKFLEVTLSPSAPPLLGGGSERNGETMHPPPFSLGLRCLQA